MTSNEKLRTALQELVDVLDAQVKSNIDEIFTFAFNHGILFEGPSYGKAHDKAKKVLEEL